MPLPCCLSLLFITQSVILVWNITIHTCPHLLNKHPPQPQAVECSSLVNPGPISIIWMHVWTFSLIKIKARNQLLDFHITQRCLLIPMFLFNSHFQERCLLVSRDRHAVYTGHKQSLSLRCWSIPTMKTTQHIQTGNT